MKDVRLFFEKRGSLKFISHLDMNRFFIRLLRKSRLDIWYTEGFNPHPYITFALPLSLGFESTYEIVDFRVNDDNLSFFDIENAFKSVVPKDIKIFKAASPVLKSGKISFTKYLLTFNSIDVASKFVNYLKGENVVISKKSKRGDIKEIDVSEKIKSVNLIDDTNIEIILPAGNDNINPSLLVSAFMENNNLETQVSYLRTALLDENCNLFE